ncbi:serine hydrolase domain-containing protein [soil metagenome]
MTSLQELLDEGLRTGLYSGAAAGIWTADERRFAVSGTHAYGDTTPIGVNSVFDLASVSKTFTAAVLLKLVESGSLSLDDPVSARLPVGIGEDASRITLRMLLSHTSGLPDVSFLWRDSPGIAPEERLGAILATPLLSAPGAKYRYSCIGYIAAAAYAEKVTGQSLPELLDELVARPLGLTSVGYGPVDPVVAVATEEEPWVGRGLVRGEVHDETSWFLGGASGNAGLFGTVGDVLSFAHTFVDGRLLGPEGLHEATTDQLAPGIRESHGQGIGPWIADRDIFGNIEAFGHPGFTGTLWLVIPATGTAAVLLTNRVHPSRDRVDLDPFRRRFVAWVAERGREM